MERWHRFLVRSLVQIGIVGFVWFGVLAPLLSLEFSVDIMALGHLNGLAITALIAWLIEDAISVRARIYARYGCREPVLRPAVRFLRTLALLVLVILAWAYLLQAQLLRGDGDDWRFWLAVGVLISTSVAATGWILTSHRNQLQATLAQTEMALRDYLQDAQNIRLRRLVSIIYAEARAAGKVKDGAVELEFLQQPTKTVLRRRSLPEADKSPDEAVFYDRPLIYLIWEQLNFFERLAHGVRRGRLDFDYTYEGMFDLINGAHDKWRLVLEDEFDDAQVRRSDTPGEPRSFDKVYVYEHLWWLIYNTKKRYHASDPSARDAALNGIAVDSNRQMFDPWKGRLIDRVRAKLFDRTEASATAVETASE